MKITEISIFFSYSKLLLQIFLTVNHGSNDVAQSFLYYIQNKISISDINNTKIKLVTIHLKNIFTSIITLNKK